MSRSRVLSARVPGSQRGALASSGGGSSQTAGALAAANWLRARGVTPPATTRWHVQIAFDVVQSRAPSQYDEQTATRFHLDIYREEWGYFVCHGGQSSWIRVTDIAFVHGRDDFLLLGYTPALKDIGLLMRTFERQHHVRFQRDHAVIDTNVPRIEPEIRGWISSL